MIGGHVVVRDKDFKKMDTSMIVVLLSSSQVLSSPCLLVKFGQQAQFYNVIHHLTRQYQIMKFAIGAN